MNPKILLAMMVGLLSGIEENDNISIPSHKIKTPTGSPELSKRKRNKKKGKKVRKNRGKNRK